MKHIHSLRKNKGFTLIELLAVVLIIGILVTVGSIAITSAIDKTNRTKVKADFNEFETALTYVINSNPQLARVTGYQNTDVLRAYNESAEPALRVDLSHCGSENNLHDGGSTFSKLSDITQLTVVATAYMDPWGTPYKMYITGDDISLTGRNGEEADSQDAELRIFIVSNGPNTIGGTAVNVLDSDDIAMLVEYVNGQLRIGYHNTDTVSANNIYWFAQDFVGFDSSKALDPADSQSVLNMNLACLEPVMQDVSE